MEEESKQDRKGYEELQGTMTNKQRDDYKAADLAYKILQTEGLVSSNPEVVRSKLQQLLRGLPVEDEFALLCLWSGRCKLIQKLDQVVFPANHDYSIPDYFCVFNVAEKLITFLVEVKSSQRDTIKFSKLYFSGLRAYSELIGIPILVAYKFTGFARPLWALFELEKMSQPTGTGKANILEMMKQDLTGVLLGNFHLQIWQGTSIVMEITKDEIRDDRSFIGTVRDLYWRTHDGKRVEFKSAPLLDWLFMMSEDDVKIEEQEDLVVQRFSKLTDEGTIAYWALPQAVDIRRYLAGEDIDWHKALLEERLSFRLPDLRLAVESALKSGLVRYIFDVVPHDMPAFLSHIARCKRPR